MRVACAARWSTDGRTDGLRAEAHADRRKTATTLRAGARGKPMTGDQRALNAVTQLLTRAGCPHPDVTATEILTVLRGHGWRPTNAQPPPPWQPHPDRPPVPPTPEWRDARAQLNTDTTRPGL